MSTTGNFSNRISAMRNRLLPGVSLGVQMNVLARSAARDANIFPGSLRAFDALFFAVKERVLQ